MVSADLEERMLPQEPEEVAEEEDWEDSWLGPLILLGLLVAGLIAAIVVSRPSPRPGPLMRGRGRRCWSPTRATRRARCSLRPSCS